MNELLNFARWLTSFGTVGWIALALSLWLVVWLTSLPILWAYTGLTFAFPALPGSWASELAYHLYTEAPENKEDRVEYCTELFFAFPFWLLLAWTFSRWADSVTSDLD